MNKKNMQFSKSAEKTLSDVTKPLLIISRLFGMNPKSHWHKIYAVFILVCEVFMMCGIWRYLMSDHFENYYFNLLVQILQNGCRLISLLIILGTGLFDRNRFMIPLKDFVNIDQSLKKLGGSLKNEDTYRLEMLIFTCIGLMPFCFWLMPNSLHSSTTRGQTYLLFLMGWFRNFIIMITCAIADCCFALALSIIRKRFRTINFIIDRFGTHAMYSNINILAVSRVLTKDDILQDLKILRKQYHDLWRIANRVNDAYGLHLLVGATTSLAVITSALWEMYFSFITSDPNAFHHTANISWILFCVVRVLFLAKVCESTVTEAKVTFVVLQELGMKRDHDPQTKAEIRDFFLQLQLEARNFTAYGFFNIDFTLVCAILGAACTYLVILIQMGNSNTCPRVPIANVSAYCDDKNHS